MQHHALLKMWALQIHKYFRGGKIGMGEHALRHTMYHTGYIAMVQAEGSTTQYSLWLQRTDFEYNHPSTSSSLVVNFCSTMKLLHFSELILEMNYHKTWMRLFSSVEQKSTDINQIILSLCPYLKAQDKCNSNLEELHN